jgi:hypothetical protein
VINKLQLWSNQSLRTKKYALTLDVKSGKKVWTGSFAWKLPCPKGYIVTPCLAPATIILPLIKLQVSAEAVHATISRSAHPNHHEVHENLALYLWYGFTVLIGGLSMRPSHATAVVSTALAAVARPLVTTATAAEFYSVAADTVAICASSIRVTAVTTIVGPTASAAETSHLLQPAW